MVDSLAPKRDIGVMADYAIGPTATLMLGVFNGEGQNVTANTDSTLLWVGRATVRPIAYLTLGANVAALRLGQHPLRRGRRAWSTWAPRSRASTSASIGTAACLDDKGWYAQGTYRVLPWVQLVLKQEDFRRSEISEALQNQATTGGVNVEFGGRQGAAPGGTTSPARSARQATRQGTARSPRPRSSSEHG